MDQDGAKITDYFDRSIYAEPIRSVLSIYFEKLQSSSIAKLTDVRLRLADLGNEMANVIMLNLIHEKSVVVGEKAPILESKPNYPELIHFDINSDNVDFGSIYLMSGDIDELSKIPTFQINSKNCSMIESRHDEHCVKLEGRSFIVTEKVLKNDDIEPATAYYALGYHPSPNVVLVVRLGTAMNGDDGVGKETLIELAGEAKDILAGVDLDLLDVYAHPDTIPPDFDPATCRP